jgi:hypothetical protein
MALRLAAAGCHGRPSLPGPTRGKLKKKAVKVRGWGPFGTTLRCDLINTFASVQRLHAHPIPGARRRLLTEYTPDDARQMLAERVVEQLEQSG